MTEKKESNSKPVEQKDDFNWDSLELQEFPVTINKQVYILVECSAEDARLWRTNNFQALQTREKGRGKNREAHITFKETIANNHLLLVSICLYKVNADGSRSRVSMDELRKWPNRYVEKLFDKAQEMSGLREEDIDGDEDTPVKN